MQVQRLTTHSRTWGRVAALVLMVVLVLHAAVASAATGQYKNSAASPNTAYYSTTWRNHDYNHIYAGNNAGLPIGIYLRTTGGSKIRARNGFDFVAYGHAPESSTRAYCWNRSLTATFIVQCWWGTP